jgi:hypothetical protein
MALTPDVRHPWSQKAWADAKHRGLDALTPEDIAAEIAAHRRENGLATSGVK